MKGSLSIVLPAFNEEGNIENVIRNIFSVIRKYVKDFEVIVIDDGSIDETLKTLSWLKESFRGLKVVSYNKNSGYGYAIRKGIEYARKKWIFIMDSDGQFRIEDFLSFWEKRMEYDSILGYRFLRRDNLYRRILTKVGNCVANVFLRKKIKDINCGFKLFRSRDLKSLSMLSTGGSIHFEMLYYLVNSKNRYLQLPVTHYKRKRGKETGGNLKVILKNLWEGRKIVCHN